MMKRYLPMQTLLAMLLGTVLGAGLGVILALISYNDALLLTVLGGSFAGGICGLILGTELWHFSHLDETDDNIRATA